MRRAGAGLSVAHADPRAVLRSPAVFRMFKRVVLPERGEQIHVRDHIRAQAGDRVLDIGCGVADVLDRLPVVDYHGFDLSQAYIDAATARYGDRGRFVCAAVSQLSLGELDGSCDVALATGVLHHLDDGEALQLLRTALAALKPGGRLVTFDGCYAPGQGRLSRWLVSQDRGQHVRDLADYARLAEQVFPEVTSHVYSDLLRIPYTHLILECTKP